MSYLALNMNHFEMANGTTATVDYGYNPSYNFSISYVADDNYTTTNTIDCNGKDPSTDAVQLCQWVLTDPSESVFVYTASTVCRYDDEATGEPACAWDTCANEACT